MSNVIERASDVIIQKTAGDDVYLQVGKAVYLFTGVDLNVQTTLQKMLASGDGFDAVNYLQKNVGKGTRVESSPAISRLVDQILENESAIDENFGD